jgi:hypothetical protein
MADAFRGLTAGEIALAESVFPNPLPYGRVRLRLGAGGNVAATLAFRARSTAITLRYSIYFASHYSDDFSKADVGRAELFLHEMTHVWQYARSGVALFLGRYGLNLATVGFRPRRAYGYKAGDSFARARIEAQAEMIGNYHRARVEGNQDLIRLLEGNLRGSGFYGL